MNRYLFFTAIYISCITTCLSQVQFTANIDSLLYQYISKHDIPSVAIGVVYGDSVIYEKIITQEHYRSEDFPKNTSAVYNIASVAKPFTSLAVMMLIEEGKIKLEDQVFTHIPYFKVDSKYGQQITVEQLLTHTSGLPDVIHPDVYKYINPDLSDDALTNHIKSLSNIKLKHKPGTKYLYSNVGYEVLGEVVANVSQMPFEQFMQTRIFKPLEMTSTAYIATAFQKSELAQPHTGHPYQKTNMFPDDQRFTPSGNLFTSVYDLNKWMIFNINYGRYKAYQPISETNFSDFTKPRINTREDGFKSLSWFVKDAGFGNLHFHDGLDLGFNSLTVLFMKSGIGITILSNHQEADCNAMLNLVLKTIRY